MIALQVLLNDDTVCTAGLGHYGSVGSHVWWRRIIVPDSDEILASLVLIVGGLGTKQDYHQWAYRTLSVGDHIRTTIVETDSPIERLETPIGQPWNSDGLLPSKPWWQFWVPQAFLGFEVSIPDEHRFQFGVRPLGATSINVEWSCLIPRPHEERVFAPRANMSLNASALDCTTGEMDWWANCRLSVGDSVDVSIDWITHVHEPITRDRYH
jgi:hypothetical protein